MFVHRLRSFLRSFRWPTYLTLSLFIWQSAGLSNYASAFESQPGAPTATESPWRAISEKMAELYDAVASLRNSVARGESGAEEQRRVAAIWAGISEAYDELRASRADGPEAEQHDREFAILSEAIGALTTKATPDGREAAAEGLLGLLDRGRRVRPERLDPDRLPHRPVEKKAPEPRVDAPDRPAQPLRVAAADGFLMVQSNPDMPTDADRQESVGVQCSDEILALAASLDNNPVRMFEHVRNSYDFQPTWGAIKGSQGAYFSRSANAHDLSSLLIALYRCSDIPARYVHGTVEVPIDRFVKWAGIENQEQASSLFSSGGIPATLVSVNGTVEFVRMEHVWVKAYVDYTPSRGGAFIEGDRWVEIDPSFKEHEILEPVDARASVNIDAEGMIDALRASGTESGDSITSVDTTVPDATRNSIRDQMLALMSGNNLDTIDELLGQKLRIQKEYGVLPISSIFDVVTVLGEYVEVPASQRYRITVRLEDVDDFGFTDVVLNQSVTMSDVAAARFTLTYAPADSATTTYLQSLLPPGPGGGRTLEDQISELPTILDTDQVRVIPELRVGGQVVATGSGFTELGSDQQLTIIISSPNGFANANFTNDVSSGVAQAISLNLGTYRNEYLQARQARIQTLYDLLSNPPSDYNVPKDDWLGEYLYLGGLNYWLLSDLFNGLIQRFNNVTATRLPSVGLFSYDLSITFSGLITFTPDTAEVAGYATDIDHDLQAVVSNLADDNDSLTYMVSSGIMGSYLEGSVWDIINSGLGDGTNGLEYRGVSTAHVLAHANANGIPIYTVDSSNWATVQPQLSLPAGVISAIGTAVAQGKYVVVPRTQVTLDNGWTGAGYAVMDKDTGAGAYLIDGGRAGGGFDLPNLDPGIVFLLGMLLLAVGLVFPAAALAAAVLSILIALLDFGSTAQDIYNNPNLTSDQQSALVGLLATFAAIGIALAVIGLTSAGTLLPFVAVCVMFAFYAAMVSLIVGGLVGLFEQINQNNQNLPWQRRRFEWLSPRSLFALLLPGLRPRGDPLERMIPA